ncbi:MAG: rhamnogalacturonan acetylesterase [Luteolibacter sp.]
MKSKLSHSFLSSLYLGGASLLACAAVSAAELKFDFGSGKSLPGYTEVKEDTLYAKGKRYGFLPFTPATPTKTRIFAADVEEGNYDVTIRFGHPTEATSTVIKGEQRRLMIEKVETEPGQYETRTFTINVRKPTVARLNNRELGPPVSPNWDDQLTLEINGKQPGVVTIDIKPAENATTLFLVGDSTVTDQRNEPYAGWGQMLPRFFQQGIAVSNQAESGLALHSFERQKRLDKVLSMMKKGDYLFIQFGHNDQKNKAPNAGPFTTYKDNLKTYIAAARKKGGIPVLVTPMERRRWDKGTVKTTLSDYAEAVRQAGAEENVKVIDLHAMSLKLYAALGEENSKKAFAFAPAGTYPGQDKAMADNTHHNSFGGYELARCIVEGIKTEVPELVPHVAKDAGTFNPESPDSPDAFEVPASPIKEKVEKPAGS